MGNAMLMQLCMPFCRKHFIIYAFIVGKYATILVAVLGGFNNMTLEKFAPRCHEAMRYEQGLAWKAHC